MNGLNFKSMQKSIYKGKKSLILVSGGMDSITLLYEFSDDIALAVSFDYGSKHNEKEIFFAKLHCDRLGIKHITIPLSFINEHCRSSLLQNGDEVSEGSYKAESMKSTVVPFRNGIMLSVAAGLAESNELQRILIANHHGDHAIYPDCRATFIAAMNKAVSYGTYESISVFAPYTRNSKSDIADHGKELNLDYSETWSCYCGRDRHCGKCGTCIERKEALRDAGIEDFTEYES